MKLATVVTRDSSLSREKVQSLLQESDRVQSLRARTAATVPGLSRLIGYQSESFRSNVPVGIASVKSQISDLWNCRGAQATKNSVPIMSTFATAGQGKTELCIQLVIDETLHQDLPDVDDFMAIHISFNQTTTFNSRYDTSPARAIAWRVLQAVLGKDRITKEEDWRDLQCYQDLETLVLDLRNALKKVDQPYERFGILLCIDETLKVESELCKRMLNELGSLQQESLNRNIPTFVLFTGLHYDNLFKEFQTDSGRPLKRVTIPTMTDRSLEEISKMVSTALISIAKYDDRFMGNCHVLSACVQRLVLWMFLRCGRHFRALENAVQRLFAILISGDTLDKYQAAFPDESSRSVLGSHHKYFRPNPEHHTVDKKEWEDGTVRGRLANSFLSTIQGFDDGGMFDFCANMFCDLVAHYDNFKENDCSSFFTEDKAMIHAERQGAVFISDRLSDEMSSVQPRVSLPYLFHSAIRVWGRKMQVSISDNIGVRPDYIWAHDGHCLQDLLPVLLANIGIGLDGLSSKLSTSFEFTMVFVELLRGYVISKHFSGYQQDFSLDNILPGAIVKPHAAGARIELASWVLGNSIIPMLRLSRKRGSDRDENFELLMVKNLMEQANTVSCIQPKGIDTKGIEYAAKHFVTFDENGYEQPVVFLVSMKLREANTVQSLASWAEAIHNLAKQAQLKSGQYYAVLYGCWPKDSIDVCKLPAGTIVVPAETILRVLRPFGGGCLELLVREKADSV